MIKEKTYEDKEKNRYMVSDGISDGTSWMVVKILYGKISEHRVKSKDLPIRETKEEAQRDLNEWAKKKGLRERK